MPYKLTFTEKIDPEYYGQIDWNTHVVSPERTALIQKHIASGNIISISNTVISESPPTRVSEIIYKDEATREFIKEEGMKLPNSGMTPGFIVSDIVGTEI